MLRNLVLDVNEVNMQGGPRSSVPHPNPESSSKSSVSLDNYMDCFSQALPETVSVNHIAAAAPDDKAARPTYETSQQNQPAQPQGNFQKALKATLGSPVSCKN